jgi:hypothetical protein
MFKQLISALLLVLLVVNSQAQQMPLTEKMHEISRVSKKGYLGQVIANDSTFDMVFVLKGGGKNTIKTETYTFDQSLNLLNTKREEDELAQVKAKNKWLTYRGDEQKFTMTSASVSYKGELVLRRKEVTQSWNWWFGYYQNSVKELEKIKAESEVGKKYGFTGGIYENYLTGKMLAYAPPKNSNKFDEGYNTYHLLSIEGNLAFEKTDELTFKGFFMPIYSKPLSDEELSTTSNEDMPRDWVTVFAATGFKGNTAQPTDYVYVRASPEGKVLEKIEFTSPTVAWRIVDIIEHNKTVTIIGSGMEKNPNKAMIVIGKSNKYIDSFFEDGTVALTSMSQADQHAAVDNSTKGFSGLMKDIKTLSSAENVIITQEDLDRRLDVLNYDHFVIGQVTNGQYKTLAYTGAQDFEKAQIKPDNQKKYFNWDGRRFNIDYIDLKADGRIVVTGQNAPELNSHKSKVSYMFMYEKDGTLRASYGVESIKKAFFSNDAGPQSDQYPLTNWTVESANKNKTYWFINKVKAFRAETSTDYVSGFLHASRNTTTSYKPLRTIRYGVIDNKTKALGTVNDLGENEKKDYYLFDNHNKVLLGDYVIYLSETKKGDKILLSRFDMNK